MARNYDFHIVNTAIMNAALQQNMKIAPSTNENTLQSSFICDKL